MISRVDRKIGPIRMGLVRKKMSRRALAELADEFEAAAGLLRRIAGVSTNDDTERSGSTD